MRFRKKPIEIDAWRWDPDHPHEVLQLPDFEPRLFGDDGLRFYCLKSNAMCTIQAGDWVIRETDGVGYYPCIAAMFEATYDPVVVVTTQYVRQGSSLHIGACPRSNPDPNLPADVPCRCGPELPIAGES